MKPSKLNLKAFFIFQFLVNKLILTSAIELELSCGKKKSTLRKECPLIKTLKFKKIIMTPLVSKG